MLFDFLLEIVETAFHHSLHEISDLSSDHWIQSISLYFIRKTLHIDSVEKEQDITNTNHHLILLEHNIIDFVGVISKMN